MLGYYLAEGHITKRIYQIGFSFNRNEKDYIKECLYLLEQFTDKKPSIRHPNPSTTQIVIHGKEFYEFFDQCVGKAKNKHLPSFVYNMNDKLFFNLLNTYIRGDGHKKSKYYIAIKSVCHQMIEELVWQCKLRGISCVLNKEINKPHKLPQGTMFKGSEVLVIRIPRSELKDEFNIKRNKFSPFPRNKTYPVDGLRVVYEQCKPKSFLKHRIEHITLRKERVNNDINTNG